MLQRIKKVEHIDEYKLRLTFRNKKKKIIDLKNDLWGELFEPLKDIEYFKLVKSDGYTIVWPNGLDLCPDSLYEDGTEEILGE